MSYPARAEGLVNMILWSPPSVSVCHALVFTRFSAQNNSIHNIIPLLKKKCTSWSMFYLTVWKNPITEDITEPDKIILTLVIYAYRDRKAERKKNKAALSSSLTLDTLLKIILSWERIWKRIVSDLICLHRVKLFHVLLCNANLF